MQNQKKKNNPKKRVALLASNEILRPEVQFSQYNHR